MYWSKKQKGVTCVRLSSFVSTNDKPLYFEVRHAERILKQSNKNGTDWELSDENYELLEGFKLKKIGNATRNKTDKAESKRAEKPKVKE